MSGKVRPRGTKCPRCGDKFTIDEGTDIYCTKCGIKPRSFYIILYWPDPSLGRDHKIYRDQDTNILDSYRRAHRLLEKIRGEIDAGTFILHNYLPKEIDRFRGHVLFPKWLDVVKSQRRAQNYTRKLDQYVRDHFIPQLGNLNMAAGGTGGIKTHHIEDFRKYVSETYKKKDGKHLSEKSVKNVMDALKEFCNWLFGREIIARVPKFAPVQVPEKLVTTMPLEDRDKALAAITSPKLKRIIDFLTKHPVRPSEACALDVSNFNLDASIVKIENSLDYDRSLKPRKNKKEYEIPLHPDWNNSCLRNRFGKEIAFPNKLGKRYNAHTLNEAWKRACNNAKVPYISLYPAGRHTTATSYATDGHSERHIELMLGQSTPGMSRKYVKRSVEMLRGMHRLHTSPILSKEEKTKR